MWSNPGFALRLAGYADHDSDRAGFGSGGDGTQPPFPFQSTYSCLPLVHTISMNKV